MRSFRLILSQGFDLRLKRPFLIEFQKRGISEKEKNSFEWVSPAKLLPNFIFEAPNAQKKEKLQICAETSETARRALWASSSRRVLSHHSLTSGCGAAVRTVGFCSSHRNKREENFSIICWPKTNTTLVHHFKVCTKQCIVTVH